MDTTSHDKKLGFLRRMIWWMPALVFAVLAAVNVALNPLSGGTVLSDVFQALVWALVVGVLVAGSYFGYKYMLERTPSS